MAYVLLALAVVSEVAATLCLKVASEGRARYFLGVVVGYLTALGLLTLVLAEGLALGVAYGIWAAAGVALVAVASRFLFGEALNRVMTGGIALIVAGVLLVELGAAH